MLILPVEKRRLPIRGVGGLKDRCFSLSAARLPDVCAGLFAIGKLKRVKGCYAGFRRRGWSRLIALHAF